MFPLCANADIIGNVSLQLDASIPSGYVTIGADTVNVYLDYDAKLDSNPYVEAFCVENANAINGSTNQYTLLKIDSTLSDYGLDVSKFLQAVVIADYYKDHPSEAMKAGAQIAIWEVMFEPSSGTSFDLTSDTFKAGANNDYVDEALSIWNTVKDWSLPTSSTEWALAVSPTIQKGDTVTVVAPQNYLVRYPTQVSEPASLLLFGMGLLGLAGIGRRIKK